jgi:hypothetical protein
MILKIFQELYAKNKRLCHFTQITYAVNSPNLRQCRAVLNKTTLGEVEYE